MYKIGQKGKNLLKNFLFLPIFLFSQELCMLPDETEHFKFKLNTQIKKAHNTIRIFTPYLNDYITIKNLKSMAKKGVKIELITKKSQAEGNQISYLSLYKNISVYHLKTDFKIKGFFVCIDKDNMFLLSNNLNNTNISKEYSFALSSTQACEQRFITLKSRCLNKE